MLAGVSEFRGVVRVAGAQRPVLSALTTLLLCVAGGSAVGGSFGVLVEEFEQAGGQTLTLSYTSWRLTQGGTYPGKIYFQAPQFGYPLVVTGVLVVLAGLWLVLRRDRLAAAVGAVAAGMLVGTVWAVGMVVAADLAAVDRTAGFTATWTSGIGFWLVSGAGVAALGACVLALLTAFPRTRVVPSPYPREDA